LSDGGDVVKPGLSKVLDLAAFDHPPIAHERHPLTTEALTRLLHLRGESFRILRVAAKNLRRDRRALLVAQQADDNLLLALLAVAVVAIGAVGIALAFQITAGHVVEK